MRALGIVLASLVSLVSLTTARAQAPAAGSMKPAYISDNECQICHSSAKIPQPDVSNVGARVTLTEWTHWEKKDKHAQAYAVLKQPLAQSMAKLLRYDVTKDVRCLSCHVGTCEVEPASMAGAPPTLLPPRKSLLEHGVSCQACHGPASRWNDPHHKPKDNNPEQYWPEQSNEYRESLGFYDAREPIKRAELCLSCHQGHAAQGKVITHEMYAAGHPPLGGFNVDIFAQAMPSHGKPLAERPDLLKRHGLRADESHAARALLTTSAVALREAVRMLADETVSDGGRHPKAKDAADPVTVWPELALFDCAACHHELRVPSDRTSRSLGMLPGRPSLRAWPVSLSSAVDAQSPQALAPLIQALNRQPFGRREVVHQAAIDSLSGLDVQLKTLRQAELRRADNLSRLADWIDLGRRQAHDFESARQWSWAMLNLWQELIADRSALTPEQRAAADPIIAELTSTLQLNLASTSASPPAPSTTGVMDAVQAQLSAAHAFRLEAYQALLKSLRQALSAT